MRIGIVRGCVVLGRSIDALKGIRLLVVEPVTAENLAAGSQDGGGKALIVADHLAPARGQSIAFTEGREAANPYWPLNVPVDAISALIVDSVDFRPPIKNGTVSNE